MGGEGGGGVFCGIAPPGYTFLLVNFENYPDVVQSAQIVANRRAETWHKPEYPDYLVTGKRLPHKPPTGQQALHLGLLCYLKRVAHLDAEIAHGAFELRVTKQ